ncbi:MAG: carbon-nitrogen hydrolase family protein [Anaerolineales bacterium]|nr:carbon-nitrogen hydrolase family protein [Anaerolineales bacterium]
MFTRRTFLQLLWAGALQCACCAVLPSSRAAQQGALRIALLHLSPQPGLLDVNWAQIEARVKQAAWHGADWVVTPELATSGYDFARVIGTRWIQPQPDVRMNRLARLAREAGVMIWLAAPERDATSGKLYNSVFVLGADGALLGRHRKIWVVQIPTEEWASCGEQATPVQTPGLVIGNLICADAFDPTIARRSKALGAQLFVSSAAWSPGECGPDPYWVALTKDTGLPLIVCNRTGQEGDFDFRFNRFVTAENYHPIGVI